MEKDKILEKLAQMDVDQIDRLRDKKVLELRDVLKQYYTALDDELVLKHTTRNVLLANGHSPNKVEQLLRQNEELYLLKRKIIALRDIRRKLELERELVDKYFWKARG